MADGNKDEKGGKKDLSRDKNAVVPETESGTTSERDFGKTDRYANTDEGKDFNVRMMGDNTAWDSGRDASITDGTAVETDTRAADAEAPGVKTRPAGPPIEPEKK
jgi:hypothetical protein